MEVGGVLRKSVGLRVAAFAQNPGGPGLLLMIRRPPRGPPNASLLSSYEPCSCLPQWINYGRCIQRPAMRPAKKHGPEFVRWFAPLLHVLRAFGGAAKPREVSARIAQDLKLPAEVTEAKLNSGANRFHNQVQWARQYLVWSGFLESSPRGIWKLSPKGWDSSLDDTVAMQIFTAWTDHRQATKPTASLKSGGLAKALPPDEEEESEALGAVTSLSPEGFEHFCQALLRESGMEDVEVTGGSHDQGIDGLGFLRLNPLLRIKVAFQCKRTSSSLGRSIVGDFRNAVMGRADKGIIFTTSWFSNEAMKEAARDGVLAIELVDGERLVELMQEHQFGLRPRTTYDVDHAFFTRFQKSLN